MSIDSTSRQTGPEGPEPEEQAPASSPSGDPAWDARLNAVNKGPGEPTALERHVKFFDTNNDNVLSVKEVRQGLQKLGMPWFQSVYASALNNLLLGPPTRDKLISFKVDINNIEKARHEGSDTGIFNAEGHFVPAKFEEMYAKFDKDQDGKLTETEIKAMVKENTANVTRGRGKFSAEAEFDLMLQLCSYTNEKGERYMPKERMLRFFDGSLFPEMAAEVKAFGAVVRHPVPGHESAGGPVAAAARRGAGPAAGPAAGAAFGDALLTGGAAGGAGASAALGGMMGVCPYAAAAAGAKGDK